MDDDLTLSNGLAWTADGSRMYSVDTGTRVIRVRDYDSATGRVGPVVGRSRRWTAGHPDGICIDAEDHLWVAVWGEGAVLRFAPDGAVVDRVGVAAPYTSSVAFAGPELDILVITTASDDHAALEIADYPDSGRLFTARPGVAGGPVGAGRGIRPRRPHPRARPDMRAFVITAPGEAGVQEVDPPDAAPGEVVVDVERAGVCGTDVEFYTGEMAYLHQGHARFPMRIGHEWMGTVSAVGEGVDAEWVGQARHGRHDARMRRVPSVPRGPPARVRSPRGGRHPRWPGRSARRAGGRSGDARCTVFPMAWMPRSARSSSPQATRCDRWKALSSIRATGRSSSVRARSACCAPCSRAPPGPRCTCSAGRRGRSRSRAASGSSTLWAEDELPYLPFDAVIDASNSPSLPARALDLVEPGRRVVYVGLAGTPSVIDTRTLVLKDVTAVGVLSASPGLAGCDRGVRDGRCRPASARRSDDRTRRARRRARRLAAGPGAGDGPKIHIDPRMPRADLG